MLSDVEVVSLIEILLSNKKYFPPDFPSKNLSLTQQIYGEIARSIHQAYSVYPIDFEGLFNFKLLTVENFSQLIRYPSQAKNLNAILCLSVNNASDFVNQSWLSNSDNASHERPLSNGNYHQLLAGGRVVQTLLDHIEYSSGIYKLLHTMAYRQVKPNLTCDKPVLLDRETLRLVLQNARFAEAIQAVLIQLDVFLWTKHNFNSIARAAEQAEKMGQLFEMLRFKNLLSQENFDYFIARPHLVDMFCTIILNAYEQNLFNSLLISQIKIAFSASQIDVLVEKISQMLNEAPNNPAPLNLLLQYPYSLKNFFSECHHVSNLLPFLLEMELEIVARGGKQALRRCWGSDDRYDILQKNDRLLEQLTDHLQDKLASEHHHIHDVFSSFFTTLCSVYKVIKNHSLYQEQHVETLSTRISDLKNSLLQINLLTERDIRLAFLQLYQAYFQFIASNQLAEAALRSTEDNLVEQFLAEANQNNLAELQEDYFVVLTAADYFITPSLIVLGKKLLAAMTYFKIDSRDTVFSIPASEGVAARIPGDIIINPELSRVVQLNLSSLGLWDHELNTLMNAWLPLAENSLPQLEFLSLEKNQLTVSSIASLAGFLQHCVRLKVLKLSHNAIGGEKDPFSALRTSGVRKILAIEPRALPDLRYLGLENTGSDAVDAKAILERLNASNYRLMISTQNNPAMGDQREKIKQAQKHLFAQMDLLDRNEPVGNAILSSIIRLYQQWLDAQGADSIKWRGELYVILQMVVSALSPAEEQLQRIQQKTSQALSAEKMGNGLTEREFFQLRAALLQASYSLTPAKFLAEEPVKQIALLKLFYDELLIPAMESGTLAFVLRRLLELLNHISLGIVLRQANEGLNPAALDQPGLRLLSLFEMAFRACALRGQLQDGVFIKKQGREVILDAGIDIVKGLSLMAAPAFGVVSGLFHVGRGLHSLHHVLHVAHELVHVAEGAHDALVHPINEAREAHHEHHEQHYQGEHHHARSLKGWMGLSTKDWDENFYKSLLIHQNATDYIRCFWDAFTERYRNQLALLSTAGQCYLLESAVFYHLQTGMQLGFFKPVHEEQGVWDINTFVEYALDWLAYVPMPDSFVLKRVRFSNDRVVDITVDLFLRGPGLRCVDVENNNRQIDFHWVKSRMRLGEDYQKHFWRKNTAFIYPGNVERSLGYRQASQREADHLKTLLENPVEQASFALCFKEYSILQVHWIPEDLQAMRDEYYHDDINLLGQVINYLSLRQELEDLKEGVRNLMQNSQAQIEALRHENGMVTTKNQIWMLVDRVEHNHIEREDLNHAEELRRQARFYCIDESDDESDRNLFNRFMRCYNIIKTQFAEEAQARLADNRNGIFAISAQPAAANGVADENSLLRASAQ